MLIGQRFKRPLTALTRPGVVPKGASPENSLPSHGSLKLMLTRIMQSIIALKLPMQPPVVGCARDVTLSVPVRFSPISRRKQKKGQNELCETRVQGPTSLLTCCTSQAARSHGTTAQGSRNTSGLSIVMARSNAAGAAPRPTRGAAFFFARQSFLNRETAKLIVVRTPINVILPAGHPIVKRGMRPLARGGHEVMFDRVEMNVFDMRGKIGVAANRMFPVSSLPNRVLGFRFAAWRNELSVLRGARPRKRAFNLAPAHRVIAVAVR